jgi:hypothetical protein
MQNQLKKKLFNIFNKSYKSKVKKKINIQMVNYYNE